MTAPDPPSVLIGSSFFSGGEDAMRRQEACVQQLLSLHGTRLVNLQFPQILREYPGFETVPQLFSDSLKVSGRTGPRKPVLFEAFNLLAQKAREYAIPYFAWTNTDILISQEAVDLVRQGGYDSFIFQRMDFDGATGRDKGFFLGGQDVFVYSVEWWERHGFRFRNYLVGEPFFDPIFTSISFCHGKCRLVNDRPLIRHEDHPRLWSNSPFADYNRYLASLDTLYWRLWNVFKEALYEIRARNGSAQEEADLLRISFPWPPPISHRLIQAGRCIKAWIRFQRQLRAAAL